MRIAALYDIHGNLPALEAVLAEVDAFGVDLMIIGGDIVMGPMPRDTLTRLLALGDRARFIRGNTERDLSGGMMDNPVNPGVWATRAQWVAEQLSLAQRDFLVGLPLTHEVDVDGVGRVLFCHATPHSDDEIITRATPDDRIAPMLAGVRVNLVVCGHTHVQYDRTVGGVRLINAGAVGLPYQGVPGAYWALLGPDVDFHRTVYDFHEAAERITRTGLPEARTFAEQSILNPIDPQRATTFFEDMARTRARS